MSLAAPRILSVGTAHPPTRYTQEDILARFRIEDPAVRSVFRSAHIASRYLYLPEPGPDGLPHESMSELLAKHRHGARELGAQALARCLGPLGATPADVDYLAVVSSTGFMLPGLSAMYVKHLGFRTDCHRLDVVGMGCNAGLNGLNPVAQWAAANPGRLAVMVCAEINSALYTDDPSLGNGVVNALFGDGLAAVALRSDPRDEPRFAPRVLGFQSHIIPDTWDAMHYAWDESRGRFGFHLDRDVPYVLGAHAETPVAALLARHGLHRRQVHHWLVHSGGRKVIDAIKYTVGLTEHDVRHTVGVLHDMGNLGSGSFLFSYERLLAEGVVRRGDAGVLMTMGPGSTIETALLRW
jgi:alkylresorcinol/alkylpyrone synthase/polyketide synthase Type III